MTIVNVTGTVNVSDAINAGSVTAESVTVGGVPAATQTDVASAASMAASAIAAAAAAASSEVAAEATARTAAIGAAIAALPTFYPTMPFRKISTAYTATSADYFIEATASAGVPTFPTAVGITGLAYIFKNRSGASITPLTTSSQTIDGSAPAAVANNGVLRIISDGTNWLTW